MAHDPRRELPAALPARLAWLNAIPNLFWTVLCLLPVGLLCYRVMERRWLWFLLSASVIPCLLPTHLLRHLQLSTGTALYRRLGMHLVNRVTQDGVWINRLVRRRTPTYTRLPSRTRIPGLIRETRIRERFHWSLLLFFLLCTIYAAARHHPVLALLILLSNAVYNLYPIGLQQYLRLRLQRSVHPQDSLTPGLTART